MSLKVEEPWRLRGQQPKKAEGNEDNKKTAAESRPEERLKVLEDENRVLRIKVKSLESQMAKNEADALHKTAKYILQLLPRLTEELNLQIKGASKAAAVYERKLKESHEQLAETNKALHNTLQQLEDKNLLNARLQKELAECTDKLKQFETSPTDKKRNGVATSAPFKSPEEPTLSKLKAELKEAHEQVSLSKSSMQELQSTLKDKSTKIALLEQELAQAHEVINHLQIQHTANPMQDIHQGAAHEAESRKEVIADHSHNHKEDATAVYRHCAEVETKCRCLEQQLFDSKVAWAEENNLLRTELELMEKAATNAKFLYATLASQTDELQAQYARCRQELYQYQRASLSPYS